ncbi:MAG: hypothetical protein V4510_09710 [bacterium]
MNSKGSARSRRSRQLLRITGLRKAKHRAYCFRCKGLTKHGVGGGRYVCLECPEARCST